MKSCVCGVCECTVCVCVQMHPCVLECAEDLLLLLRFTLLVDCVSLNLRFVILSGLDGERDIEMPHPFPQYPRKAEVSGIYHLAHLFCVFLEI